MKIVMQETTEFVILFVSLRNAHGCGRMHGSPTRGPMSDAAGQQLLQGYAKLHPEERFSVSRLGNPLVQLNPIGAPNIM